MVVNSCGMAACGCDRSVDVLERKKAIIEAIGMFVCMAKIDDASKWYKCV